jgi:hypothetical protein
VAVRTKHSVSISPELAREIERAAKRERTTFSGWLAVAAARRLKLDEGKALIADWERETGPFTAAEIAEADARVRRMLGRPARRRKRRTA